MWGVNGFGSESFGHVRVDVVSAVEPVVAPVVAHLVGVEPSFALVGREPSQHVDCREPDALSLPTMVVH